VILSFVLSTSKLVVKLNASCATFLSFLGSLELFVFESVAGAGHAHKRTDDDAVLNAACSRDGDGGLITRVVRLNRSLMNCCSVFASIYSIS